MAASRWVLLRTTLFRTQRTISPFSSSAKSSFPSHPFLNFHRLCSSIAVDTLMDQRTEPILTLDRRQLHPWSEWVAFVDRLKTQGYLSESSPSPFPSPLSSTEEVEDEAGDVTVSATNSVYMDMNLLKDACLSFARDRYDIFKSLSVQDVEAVIERGCPNLFPKVVNSAKRLRAQLQMDEGEVCSTCNLRGSCDRAYVILKNSEASAGTVDIVLVLLFYALDPLVISGGEKPPGRDAIESSVRRLLSELNEFSEAPPSPALPQPAVRTSPKSSVLKLENDKFVQDFEMRVDWLCPKCNFLNFSRNMQCLHCKEDRPEKTDTDDVEIKKGDWICPECNFLNFSRNKDCIKCNAEGPKRAQSSNIEMKKGDWNCPQCKFMNFARNMKCLHCRNPRDRKPGEWECPSCDFLNYSRNVVCRKCSGKRPEEEPSSE